MTSTPSLKPVIVQPGDGASLHAFGDVYRVQIGGTHSAGRVAVVFGEAPPGNGPPPHVHSNEDEMFFVFEGELSFWADDQWTPAKAGAAVFLPRGYPHTFRNSGTTTSRFWVVTFPSGFEQFIARSAEEFGRSEPPTPEKIVEICRQFGIELLGGPPG